MNKGFWAKYGYHTIIILLQLGLYVKIDMQFQDVNIKQNFITESVLRLQKPIIMDDSSEVNQGDTYAA